MRWSETEDLAMEDFHWLLKHTKEQSALEWKSAFKKKDKD